MANGNLNNADLETIRYATQEQAKDIAIINSKLDDILERRGNNETRLTRTEERLSGLQKIVYGAIGSLVTLEIVVMAGYISGVIG